MIIAVNGKGGTGKTTISALFVKHLEERKAGSLLAIDADPNSNLPELLGIEKPKTIVGIVEEISKNPDLIPQGVTKDRFIEMRIHEEALTEADDFDLVVMGRPEGPGCYCYVNSLLRDMIARITRNYDFVVMDNAAGMEHISRRTARSVDKLVIVSDYSLFGVRSAGRIYELAKELEIKMRGAYLVVNKADKPVTALEGEIAATGLKFIGTVPLDEGLNRLSVSNEPIFGYEDEAVRKAIDDIMKKIVEG